MACISNCLPSQCRCHNELNLEKACIKCLRADCAKVCQVIANDICSQQVSVQNLSAVNQVSNNLCVPGTVSAQQVNALNIGVNSICAVNATLNSACIDNLQISNFNPNVKYRATVNYSSTANYTLGDFVNFNNIVDDPNSNISMSPNTSYTAPVSGYYMFSYKVNIVNLQSNDPILGVPVSSLEVYSNGQLVREDYKPFLTFFPGQKALVSSLITLQAGDVITLKYNVLAGNGVPVVGSVDIVGTGIEDGNSFFKIILISGFAGGSAPACAKCPVINIPCIPIQAPCAPLAWCPVPNPVNPCDDCSYRGM